MEMMNLRAEKGGDRMETVIWDMRTGIDEEGIQKGGEILRSGGLVAFPTETVYGLGGNALDAEASRKIYAAKGRPSDNPLIVHIADLDALEPIVRDIPDTAMRLAEKFWPGPMTIIFRRSALVPLETTGGLDTVAVRLPSNETARALIRAAGGYVAAPSANTSGRPSPTLASHVIEDLNGKIDMIIDGGEVGIGLESSIIDLTEDKPVILRPGYVSREMFAEAIGEVEIDRGLIAPSSGIRPKAPGMKYRHYAPKARLYLVDGNQEDVVNKIRALVKEELDAGGKPGILAAQETASLYPEGYVKCIGARLDGAAVARHLYAILREFDEAQVTVIYSELFDAPGIGPAIMNRLRKAAGQQVIQV